MLIDARPADPAAASLLEATGVAEVWPALRLACSRHGPPRVPVWIDGQRAGSVAHAHLALLDGLAWCRSAADGVHIAGQPGLSEQLADCHRAWHQAGVIRGWRDERYAWLDAQGRCVAAIERSAARFWGSLSFGAHGNGYLPGPDGRPQAIWIARRALNKPTDPGRLDNLIGGGVPLGQTPHQALLREAWEEAGLTTAQLTGVRAGSVLALHADVPEGRQHEWLHVYDLALPADWRPHNQDGEVAEFLCVPVDEALACAAAGAMTTDAALSTLDFALRHQLLPAAQAPSLQAAWAALQVPEAIAQAWAAAAAAGP